MAMIASLSRRQGYGLGALVCAGMLGFAYFAQYGLGLEPCPLCIFQRMVFFGLFVFFLIGAIQNPGKTGARVYGLLLSLIALTGVGIAGRHVWIQHLPADQVPECGPGLDYMLDVFPLGDVIRTVLTGSGECAEIVWEFLGLSMPAWTLVWYVLLALWALYFSCRGDRRPARI